VLDVLSAVTIGRLDAAEVRKFVHTFDLVSIHDDGRVRKKRVDTKVLDLGLWPRDLHAEGLRLCLLFITLSSLSYPFLSSWAPQNPGRVFAGVLQAPPPGPARPP